MKSQFIFCQRFQSFKNYIDTKLHNILVAYSKEIEHVINEIDFLTFYIKDDFKCIDFNVVAQSTLMTKIINDKQNVNAYAKSTIIIANNISNNCQSNDEYIVENKSIVLNHNTIFELILINVLRRTLTTTMRRFDTTTMKKYKTKNR